MMVVIAQSKPASPVSVKFPILNARAPSSLALAFPCCSKGLWGPDFRRGTKFRRHGLFRGPTRASGTMHVRRAGCRVTSLIWSMTRRFMTKEG
jgi:hypothetical protein